MLSAQLYFKMAILSRYEDGGVAQNSLILKVVEGNEEHLVIVYTVIGGFWCIHVDLNPRYNLHKCQLEDDRHCEH